MESTGMLFVCLPKGPRDLYSYVKSASCQDLLHGDDGVEQNQSTMQDEGLPQTVQNLKDDHVKEPVSISDEKPSTTKSTIKIEPIPRDLVLIPPYVYRPLPKQKPRFLSK